jgi:hypothetical protein
MNQIEINTASIVPSKENIKLLSEKIIQSVKDGEQTPLELAVRLTALEKVCEQVREGISEDVLNELSKYSGKTEIFGAKVERKETGTKYDFSQTSKWVNIKAKEDAIAAERKNLETMLKTIPGVTQVIEDDEVIELIPAAKTSKTSFAITLSK